MVMNYIISNCLRTDLRNPSLVFVEIDRKTKLRCVDKEQKVYLMKNCANFDLREIIYPNTLFRFYVEFETVNEDEIKNIIKSMRFCFHKFRPIESSVVNVLIKETSSFFVSPLMICTDTDAWRLRGHLLAYITNRYGEAYISKCITKTYKKTFEYALPFSTPFKVCDVCKNQAPARTNCSSCSARGKVRSVNFYNCCLNVVYPGDGGEASVGRHLNFDSLGEDEISQFSLTEFVDGPFVDMGLDLHAGPATFFHNFEKMRFTSSSTRMKDYAKHCIKDYISDIDISVIITSKSIWKKSGSEFVVTPLFETPKDFLCKDAIFVFKKSGYWKACKSKCCDTSSFRIRDLINIEGRTNPFFSDIVNTPCSSIVAVGSTYDVCNRVCESLKSRIEGQRN